MMYAIDPADEQLAIRICPIVDILVIIGTLGPDISRESALEILLSKGATTLSSRNEMLEAMQAMSIDDLVQYIDSREDRVFLCNTIFGGAAFMMDCGPYRVFYHKEDGPVEPGRPAREAALTRPGGPG